jgi:hypothetical protein
MAIAAKAAVRVVWTLVFIGVRVSAATALARPLTSASEDLSLKDVRGSGSLMVRF